MEGVQNPSVEERSSRAGKVGWQAEERRAAVNLHSSLYSRLQAGRFIRHSHNRPR